MPIFPWRFIDSLLGRSRPGDQAPATAEDVQEEIARAVARLDADIAATQHLDDTARSCLRVWVATMLTRRVPAADGRMRRDMHVQLGAVTGAIRAIVQSLDEAIGGIDGDARGQRLTWRLRSIESEIASPLYTPDEQALVRARVDRALQPLEASESAPEAASLIPGLVEALTPPDS
jgi:hypothetical protein